MALLLRDDFKGTLSQWTQHSGTWTIIGNTILKGNLHTHTNNSDGANTVEDIITRYKDLGYGFVAITDHDVWTDVSGVQDLGIIVFEGIEHSSPQHWLEILDGSGGSLTCKCHPQVYNNTCSQIEASGLDVHEATNLGVVNQFYTTCNHPYIYTDDAHTRTAAGRAWIEVQSNLNKADILMAIKQGNYTCHTSSLALSAFDINVLQSSPFHILEHGT